MNRFIIVDGLPYLYANGKAYKVRWNEEGFTVGEEVELTFKPTVTYSELSIKAKCADNLDSIGVEEKEADEDEQEQEEVPEVPEAPEEVIEDEPEEVPETSEEVKEELPQLDKFTVAELKEYAETKGIDLGNARLKAEIIEAIENAIG